MKRQFVAAPVKSAAPLAVVSTQPSRFVSIQEDDATAAQGIVLYFAQDNYTRGYTISPANQPYELGNPIARGGGRGAILGHPAQIVAGDNGPITLRPADTYFKVTSATATATNVRVEEHS